MLTFVYCLTFFLLNNGGLFKQLYYYFILYLVFIFIVYHQDELNIYNILYLFTNTIIYDSQLYFTKVVSDMMVSAAINEKKKN